MATRTANRATSHTALLQLCEQYLQVRGAYTLRIMAGIGQRRGSPDLVCCLRGRLIALDAKTGEAKMTVEQNAERHRIMMAGGVYIVARSVDDVEHTLLDAGLVDVPVLWPRMEQ